MFSLMEIDKYLTEKGYDARIVTTVHDSIIIECKDEEWLVNDIAAKAKEIMASTPSKYVPDCPLPFKADAEVGYAWGKLEGWEGEK